VIDEHRDSLRLRMVVHLVCANKALPRLPIEAQVPSDLGALVELQSVELALFRFEAVSNVTPRRASIIGRTSVERCVACRASSKAADAR